MNGSFRQSGRRSVLSLLFFAVVFIGVAWALLQFERWRQVASQERLLESQAVAFDRQLDQLAFIPKLLASDPRVVDALVLGTQSSIDTANQTLAEVRQESGVAFAFIMDRSGNTIAASNYQSAVSFVGINYGFRPYFTGARGGQESRFFGVGATTGEAGYFIALPVRVASKVAGVVVVKLSLGALIDSWSGRRYDSVVVDELGVIILSTRVAWLYTETSVLDNEARALVRTQRRYSLNDNVQVRSAEPGHWQVTSEAGSTGLATVQQSLKSEPWTLYLALPEHRLWSQALLQLSALCAVAVIASLIYKNNRQHRRLASMEQRHAERLEAQVHLRTQQLESAQEALVAHSNFAMLGRMSAAINHEINQPLASLRLNLASLRQLMSRKNPPFDEISQIVLESDRTTHRIGRVVASLRSVSRHENAGFSPTEVNRMLQDVADAVQRERPHSASHLCVKTADRELWVSGHEVLLQQALLNLLNNAFDAVLNREHPIATLEAEEIGDTVCLRVSDNGPGVPETLLTELFKPFVSDPDKTSGLGLGLTLAQMIVRNHDGQLRQCNLPSGGCEFVITLAALKHRPTIDPVADHDWLAGRGIDSER